MPREHSNLNISFLNCWCSRSIYSKWHLSLPRWKHLNTHCLAPGSWFIFNFWSFRLKLCAKNAFSRWKPTDLPIFDKKSFIPFLKWNTFEHRRVDTACVHPLDYLHLNCHCISSFYCATLRRKTFVNNENGIANLLIEQLRIQFIYICTWHQVAFS